MIVLLTLLFSPLLLLVQYTPLAVFTLLPLLLLGALTLDYGACIMNSMAKKSSEPPPAGSALQGLNVNYLVRHAALVLAVVFLSAEGLFSESLPGRMFGLAFIFLLPAALIVLARDKTLSSALNPGTLLLVAKSLGRDYVLICALMVLFVYCVGATAHVANMASLQVAWALLWLAGVIYGIYFLYAVCGYALYYYQDDLGMRTHSEEDTVLLTKMEFQRQRALGESGVLMAAGEFVLARKLIQSTFETCKDDQELHLRYHMILMKIEDDQALKNHTNYLINLLLAEDSDSKASEVYVATLRKLGECEIADPAHRISLARQLRAERRIKESIFLLKSFHQRFPESELIQPAYELAADILENDLGDQGRAAALLQFLKDNPPGESGAHSEIQ